MIRCQHLLFLWFFLYTCPLLNAQLIFKNASPYKVYIAIGYYENGVWKSKGWYSAAPGAKTQPFSSLKNRYYYCLVIDEHGNMWNGEGESDASWFYYHPTAEFSASSYSCSGCKSGKFSQIDTKGVDQFTLNLTFEYEAYCYEGYRLGGYGKMKLGAGTWYEGYFDDEGLFHGQGRYDFSGGYYEGAWNHGDIHGYGTFSSGNSKYVGEFINNTMWGEGAFYSNGKLCVRGYWSNGDLITIYDKPELVWQLPDKDYFTINHAQLNIKIDIKSKTEVTAWYVYANNNEIKRAVKGGNDGILARQLHVDMRSFSGKIKANEFYGLAIPEPEKNIGENVATTIELTLTLQVGWNTIYAKAKNQGGETISVTRNIYYQP